MNFSPTRRTGAFAILLYFNFAICRAALTSISTGTESHHSKIASEESKANILGIANEPDRYWTNIHYLDTEPHNLRLDPSSGLYINTIYCWPSMGGIIIAERVLAVELAYIGLDRFHSTPRSSNHTEEDLFCTRLRKIGGKWWSSWWGAGRDGQRSPFGLQRGDCLPKMASTHCHDCQPLS